LAAITARAPYLVCPPVEGASRLVDLTTVCFGRIGSAWLPTAKWFGTVCPPWVWMDRDAGGLELVDDRLFGGLCFTLIAQSPEKVIEAVTLFAVAMSC
jgi:hypothetical protein